MRPFIIKLAPLESLTKNSLKIKNCFFELKMLGANSNFDKLLTGQASDPPVGGFISDPPAGGADNTGLIPFIFIKL
ncbi:MAG: hypothetical protein AAB465_01170 [Patescibacteria group bacterium]